MMTADLKHECSTNDDFMTKNVTPPCQTFMLSFIFLYEMVYNLKFINTRHFSLIFYYVLYFMVLILTHTTWTENKCQPDRVYSCSTCPRLEDRGAL